MFAFLYGLCLLFKIFVWRRWKIPQLMVVGYFYLSSECVIVTIPFFPLNKQSMVNVIGFIKRTGWLFDLLEYISCIFFVYKVLPFFQTLPKPYIEYSSDVKVSVGSRVNSFKKYIQCPSVND